ncbi:MAG: DEAD/DEAH box helicase family protein [Caldilineaceae bacterium]|nr:DEAD/DEAH box helicase family protein [Caldilineaceae bacterium]
MAAKEAKARIKINRLLEEAGWRLLDSEQGKANVVLESNVKITTQMIDALGDDFEQTSNGFIDFLLLNEYGFPLAVLEAKSEDKNPLVGKEQARKYAQAQNCRFVILSNGNLHYFWDLAQGNPLIITKFPAPASVDDYRTFQPVPQQLIDELVNDDYIVLTQRPNYANEAGWKNEDERPNFTEQNKLRFLRRYQKRAVHAIQRAVMHGADRFLFEMATGTGKTLTSAAVIKLFLRSGNARRVLFLVDRLELEDQAHKAFAFLLKNDYQSVIYKENRDDWRRAEIVVTTVQSLLFNNKYQRLFSPTDFDLVISDEAHRSIGGNARAVFEYFVGYKLGLTATPRDYLKNFDTVTSNSRDPRELERRLLLDTYRTFGCEGGTPTFRYTLLDGVRDRFLINPIVVDARTDISTQLLSQQGYIVDMTDEEGRDHEVAFKQRDFEKNFFAEATNRLMCQTFLAHALRDPISNEIGKSIVFAVSQNHAAKLTQILNELAEQIFPGQYQSDFAVQVTSQIADAQQFTINFTNNNLLGSANGIPTYRTSKARVCVTVGMMTTGYDCPDLLNLCLMRPIFSPTDFIQIKGRGTRKHNFLEQLFDPTIQQTLAMQNIATNKQHYKLFDFFANCEYFEKEFNYDQVLVLPQSSRGESPIEGGEVVYPLRGEYESMAPDALATLREEKIGFGGMKIDRMFYQRFEERVQNDDFIREQVTSGNWDRVLDYLHQKVLNQPAEFFTLEKLRQAAGVDRRLSSRELLEKAMGLIPKFKSKDELLEEEFQKFIADLKPEDSESIVAMKYFFKAYITDGVVRDIIEQKRLTDLNTTPAFTMQHYRAVPHAWRTKIPEYVKDYVSLNQFL